MTPSEAIALYGTDEPIVPPVILKAGPLTAEFEAGNLRHIKVGGVEVIRAISFIVRDRNWGTYTPVIDDLTLEQHADEFTVRYRAETRDETQRFLYRAVIEGRNDFIRFSAEGNSASGFETNRTGFVVLHPVQGVAGMPVEIEHVDGRVVSGRFPDLIDPIQPMMDLRALSHEAAPGLRVICRMEGDTFEMEDQRNWCDASYKTYVRPLSRPWPYRIEQGAVLQQSVSLTIEGQPQAEAAGGETTVALALGDPLGPAPAVGLGYDPAEAEATQRVLPQLKGLHPQILVCHFNPRYGHDRAALETAVSTAKEIGAEPWLAAVIVSVEGYAEEIAALGTLIEAMGSPFRAILLSPACDLKSTTPGQPWPAAPPHDAFYRAARSAFPDVLLGGGMLSSFTELNRKRPPLDHLDFVGFTTMALVHAADDVSVIEGLEALPSIARSARAIAGSLPIVVGPSAIGLRMNPYGAGPVPNPGNVRQAMALNDPRHRAMLGAAWAIGYYAHLARAGAQAVIFGGTTGPFGVVHTRQDWPTPGYDEEAAVYPVFHALRSLLPLRGRAMRMLDISQPGVVQGVATEAEDGLDLVLTNLTARPVRVALPWPAETRWMLAANTVPHGSTGDGTAFGKSMSAATGTVTLAPFGLVHLHHSRSQERPTE